MKKRAVLLLAGVMLALLAACATGPSAPSEIPQVSEPPQISEPPEETVQSGLVSSSQQKLLDATFGKGFACRARLEYVYAGQTVSRLFYYYIPSTWEAGDRLPLMFSLHGSGSSAQVQLYWGNWAALAEREGFVVIIPEAVGVHADGTLSSEGKTLAQMGRAPTDVSYLRFHAAEVDPCGQYGVDDVQYLSDLIDIFVAKGYVDQNRVYSCGFSHGGFMSLRLAVEAPEKFAGVAAVSGLLCQEYGDVVPSEKCKVVFIQGDEDPHVPIEGMHYDYDGDGIKETTWALSLDDSVDYFLKNYGVPNTPVVTTLPDCAPDDGTIIKRYEYAYEDGTVQLVKYVVEGGGHTWPGGTEYYGSGTVSKDAQAAELIWAELKDAARE